MNNCSLHPDYESFRPAYWAMRFDSISPHNPFLHIHSTIIRKSKQKLHNQSLEEPL